MSEFDIIVIGAGIAGCAAAYALGNDGYKVLLVERDLKEPDRIVGELLQPGGIQALNELGMQECIEDIDGITNLGYAVIKDTGESVVLSYPNGDFDKGMGFHHGKFIQQLRKKASSCENVTVLEGTATELLKCEISERYLGVRVKSKKGDSTYLKRVLNINQYFADLTIVADGCFSTFRKQFITKEISTNSYFTG
jgi:squalene monooxygenase